MASSRPRFEQLARQRIYSNRYVYAPHGWPTARDVFAIQEFHRTAGGGMGNRPPR